MTQSKIGSFIEACINTAIGFVISMVLGMIVYPIFGHTFTFAQNFGITVVFTVASVARGYVVRRWFNDRLHRAVVRAVGEV